MSLLLIHLLFVFISVGMIVFSVVVLKSKAPVNIEQRGGSDGNDDDDDGGLGIDLRDFPDFDLPPGVYLESEGDVPQKRREKLEEVLAD
jgi:hypothetical protein